MTRLDIPIPGLLWGDYPERRVAARRLARRCSARAARHRRPDRRSRLAACLKHGDARWLARVRQAESRHSASRRIDAARPAVHAALLRDGLRGAALARAFGLVSLVTRQRELDLAPFDTQLIAARTVLDGQLAEMATGEGKTLAVGLAAAVAALAGMPVHVITANDYLVERDAPSCAPLYRRSA